jgi:molybdopterin-biosynthesis enzyme MoeA-like protein
MVTSLEQTFLFVLPGVPPEMKAIFDESAVPIIKKKTGGFSFLEHSLFVDDIMESRLAP